ncbi:hypothetical protein BX265_7263 [Streptomyces sp. TLI_235]|nr:hypothetical protein BX265_7263 [Streptomyces sp. TLI_235]
MGTPHALELHLLHAVHARAYAGRDGTTQSGQRHLLPVALALCALPFAGRGLGTGEYTISRPTTG